ncbi:MAG: hypothetical protein RL076_1831 [Chloroflexota bacterium]|jgi:hypothetical protein
MCGGARNGEQKYKAHTQTGITPLCVAPTRMFSKRNNVSIRFTKFHSIDGRTAAVLGNEFVALHTNKESGWWVRWDSNLQPFA